MRVICDVEANGLDDADKIWCVVAKDIDTKKVYTFDRVWENPSSIISWSAGVTQWTGHNFLGYDIRVLRGLLGVKIDPKDVVDTLVVSRLINFARPGGHGLESYGIESGILKPEIEDWSQYDPKMIHRCQQDIEINEYVLEKYQKYLDSPRWQTALKIEHGTADYCRRLHENGFPFDIAGGRDLLRCWVSERDELLQAFQADFPARSVRIREIVPRLTQSGRLHAADFRWYDGDPSEIASVGTAFSLLRFEPFNPGSPQQVIDRLWTAGWKPTQKTDGHKTFLRQPKRQRDPVRASHYTKYGWKLDELNLSTVPEFAPRSIQGLTRFLELKGKISQLEQWIELYNEDTQCIHGSFMSIGAWSHRAAHSKPNMANASSDHVVRDLWTSGSSSRVLVGTDADQIQLRILSHYMNDEDFKIALETGDKALGTDVHSLNARNLGAICLRDRPGRPKDKTARDDAKTFIYGFLLGAQSPKVAEIFECSVREAQNAVDDFIRAYPGLKKLKEKVIPEDARRGYFEGIDGRYVRQPEERLILAGYLQNGESIIMKLARAIWEDDLRKQGIWYQPVNWVHDEYQTLAKPDDAETVGEAQRRALLRAGEILKLNISTPGQTKVGLTWAQTH